VCSATADGTCGWQIRSCPTDACPGLGCFPSCPNGILKDTNGCDTCQCAPVADAGDAGRPCASNRDCGGDICGFLESDGCSAVGSCFAPMIRGCNGYSPGCACDGSEVNVVCNQLPSGYAAAPLMHTGACLDAGPPNDSGDAGGCCPAAGRREEGELDRPVPQVPRRLSYWRPGR
jgi:hypothetical protein